MTVTAGGFKQNDRASACAFTIKYNGWAVLHFALQAPASAIVKRGTGTANHCA